MVPLSKSGFRASGTWVRIPPSPPACIKATAGKPVMQIMLSASQPYWEYFMWYVYILWSTIDNKIYVGSTNDLKRRFLQHNNGEVESTKGRRPLIMKAYIAVENKTKAIELEQYLKTGSGRAFLNNHIL
jgi:putative endonuclease